MLVRLIDHQIPVSPRIVDDKNNARGMRKRLKTIPTMVGGTDFPKPLKAPCVVISKHINT